jgi:hypothetical protein
MRWQFFKTDEKKTNLAEKRLVNNEWVEIQCPLCGKKFRAGEAMQCATCALAVRCGLVMCPNCSYEFPA